MLDWGDMVENICVNEPGPELLGGSARGGAKGEGGAAGDGALGAPLPGNP